MHVLARCNPCRFCDGCPERAGRPVLTVDGRALSAWTFDANNVLAWDNEAGYAAWLQFMALPGGPVFMGSLRPVDDAEGAPAGARPLNPGTVGSLRSRARFCLCIHQGLNACHSALSRVNTCDIHAMPLHMGCTDAVVAPGCVCL